jgi:hypothetical protein
MGALPFHGYKTDHNEKLNLEFGWQLEPMMLGGMMIFVVFPMIGMVKDNPDGLSSDTGSETSKSSTIFGIMNTKSE